MKNETDPLKLLSSLETYGYDEREMTIGDVKLKLAPLTAREVVDVLELSSQYNDADAAIQVLKIETIARSLIAVNNIKFDPTVISKQKREIIDRFSDDLVDVIFNQYCELDKGMATSVKKEEDKKFEIEDN